MRARQGTGLVFTHVALTTDFQTYWHTCDRPALAFPDPLLDILLTEVVRVHRLAPPPAHSANRFEAYLRRNLLPASGPETPPGAALITGACAATRWPVLAADPGGCWTFADGREPNWRNLMIQYAITGRFATIGELAALVGVR